MADIISLQELADAKLDAKSLEQFINGGVDEEVLTRLSQQYPTMQNFLFQFQKYNSRAYKTFADMDADKATISAKSKVTVTNDATASNNGDWQWDGAVFTKVETSNNPYTISSTPDDLFIISDALDNVLFSIGRDGTVRGSFDLSNIDSVSYTHLTLPTTPYV